MARFFHGFEQWAWCLMCFCLIVGLSVFIGSFMGCGSGTVEEVHSDSVVACAVDAVRYPTTAIDFGRLYHGRSFRVDGVHLGRDIDLPEGTAVHPIGCGAVRAYRAATGYGTLVVVVEHRLATPVRVRNGVGEMVEVREFLSIYGHLRSTSTRSGGTSLNWRVGDRIDPERVLGYVQYDALNGDGAEHLHFGIRLQNLEDAQRTDASWFRGYDSSPSQRQWFADPQLFISALQSRGVSVIWHPPGTVLARASRPTDRWVVTDEQTLRPIDGATLVLDRLTSRVVMASDEEIGCYRVDAPYVSERRGFRIMRFSDTPAVYEYSDTPRPVRFTFISQEAFLSWGWRNEEVEFRPATERAAFFGRYADQGMRRLRDGSLVKGRGVSEVSVVSHGLRLPVADWSIFLGLGYHEENILEIDPTTLNAVAGPLGSVITLDRVRMCRYRDCALDGSCPPPPAMMDAGVATIDAGRIDASVEEPLPGGVRDAGLVTDTMVDVAMDSVRVLPSEDAGVPSGMDAGLLEGGADAGSCSDPIRPPPVSVMDAGVASMRDAETAIIDVMASAPDVRMTLPPDVMPPAPPTPPPVMGTGMRYEFRLARDTEGWAATTPYYLRDRWWRIQPCLNVRSSPSDPAGSRMESVGDGWYRCELVSPLSPFVGTFFSPSHPDSGDRGHIGTVGNWPERCTPCLGVEWRITDLSTNRRMYEGPASGLPCVADGSQDRHRLP